MAELYVNNNGTILSANEPSIYVGSRAFIYGDGLFETIRVVNGAPINVENHYNRLVEGAKVLQMRIPVYFTADFLTTKIKELLIKSAIKAGGKCHVHIDRASGGTFFPETNEISYFIDVSPLPFNYFELNPKGYEIDIYQRMKKQKDILSNFKTKNSLLSVMTAMAAREKEMDDLLLTNEAGSILESSSSNIFIASNGVLYTPGLEDGCTAGTMRMQVINLAIKNNIRVYECSIMPQNLLVADEIFLTNAVKGVIWVGGYRTKRYENEYSKRLVSLLNNYWKNELEKLNS